MKPMRPMRPGGTTPPAPGPGGPSGAPPPPPADPDAPRPAWSRESALLRLDGGLTTLDDITPEWAWGGSTGRGIRVAVIDSGIEADHPDLDDCVDRDGSVVVALNDEGEPEVTVEPHDDLFGHGTACAGIIHRLAPDARITSVRVLGAGLSGKATVFLTGLAWAIEQGFDVINLSLGTGKRDWALPFYELCDKAYFKGSLLVTAANNMARPSYPSLYASVTSVACNLSKDPFHFHYNPDPPTEFLAPGIDVEVSWRGGTRQSGTGNSYAAPHLAGIATLIKSKHGDLRPFQLKTVLMGTASNVQEASTAAGRLTGALTAARLTALGGRATSALSAVAHQPS
jgi:subtilisin